MKMNYKILFFCLAHNISYSQPGNKVFMIYSDHNMIIFQKDTISFNYEINSIDINYLLSNEIHSRSSVNYITDFTGNFFYTKIINKKTSDTTAILFEIQNSNVKYVYDLILDTLVNGNYYVSIDTICTKKVEVGKLFRNGCEISFNDLKIQNEEVFNNRLLEYNKKLHDNQIYQLYLKCKEYKLRRNKRFWINIFKKNEK